MSDAKDVTLVPKINVDIAGNDELTREIKGLGKNIDTKAYAVTRHYGTLLQAEIRARARTLFHETNYDSSIRLEMSSARTKPTAEVGTNQPQGYRLELGFVGVDSLGRHVEQPPRPHFRPAFDRIAPRYLRAISRLGTPSDHVHVETMKRSEDFE